VCAYAIFKGWYFEQARKSALAVGFLVCVLESQARRVTRLEVQPRLIQGGTMRDYQVTFYIHH
jgi:hypothetical protein